MTETKLGRPYTFEPPPFVRAAIRDALLGGDSIQMIADRYSVSWRVMDRFTDRYKLKPPTPEKSKRGTSDASLANIRPKAPPPPPLPSATGDLAGVRLGLSVSVQAVSRGASTGLQFNPTRDDETEDE